MPNETSLSLRAALVVAAESSVSLDEKTQIGAWRLAEKTKDISLLVALTGRMDLIPELKAKAKARKDIPIRVEYLNREDVSTSQEFMDMLEPETRAGVLSGICGGGSLSDHPKLAALLLERMKAKPTRALSEAIVSLDGATPELYGLALQLLSGKSNFTGDIERLITRRISNVCEDPDALNDLVDGLVDGGKSVNWMRDIASADNLGSKGLLKLVNRSVLPAVASTLAVIASGSYNRYYADMNLRNLVSAVLDNKGMSEEVLLALLAALEPGKQQLPAIYGMVQQFDPEKVKKEAEARKLLLEEAETSSSVKTLLKLIEANSRDWEVLDMIITNPHLSGEALELMIVELADAGNFKKIQKLIQVHPQDKERLMLLAYEASITIAIEDQWKSFTDPVAAKAQLMRLASRPSPIIGSAHRYFNPQRQVVSLVNMLAEDDPTLLEADWQVLEQLLQSSWTAQSEASRKLCNCMAKRQAEVLGDDPAKWETMSVLAAGFEGSIKDLIATAATL